MQRVETEPMYGKDIFKQTYNEATSEPYAFLYINMMAKNKEDMFLFVYQFQV